MKIMKAIKYISIAALAVSLTACKYDVQPDKLYLSEDGIKELTADGKIYHLDELVETFCLKEEGNYKSDTVNYRTRATDGSIYLFSIDTLPSSGPGIYIRGRVSTDDYGGNFYKALVIQEIVDGKQQNLRLSIDMGSASGMYPRGQEILIRCNGLAIGRYANQPQLCVPSYNNNTNAQKSEEKVGWNPGRIPAPLCRTHFHLIGLPDESKLVYDTVTIAECFSDFDDFNNPNNATAAVKYIKDARHIDGRLIVVKDVYFDGTEDNYGDSRALIHYDPKTDNGNPENKDSYADVFAPTTANVGHPQSRYVKDANGNRILISSSEYAKYAYFYLPFEYVNGAVKYGTFKGNIRGIFGFYLDNAGRIPDDKNEWKSKCSITICDLSDLDLKADGTGEVPAGTKWGPYTRPDGQKIDLRKEWQMNIYERSILQTNEEKRKANGLE